jgi:hypothetical protein
MDSPDIQIVTVAPWFRERFLCLFDQAAALRPENSYNFSGSYIEQATNDVEKAAGREIQIIDICEE